jgi:MATE family multidrug resistance protein
LVLAVSIGALFLNGVLCYGLLHGAFGLPKLGYLGSAWASAITIWMQVAAMSLGMRLLRGLPRVRLIGPVDTKIVRELISLGWPIGITVAVEAGVFFAGALVMGTISNAALAAHQIAIQVAALMFMVPMAIGQAANVRVGYHTGGGASRAAQQAGYAALLIGAVVALTAALGIISAPRAIALLFGLSEGRAGDAEVIALASQLLVICAAFQLADGTQAIAAGALRGLKDTRVPMIAAAGGYWAIGFPCAWALAVPFGQGATGVWWGLALGLAVVATLLTWRFARMSSRPLDRFQMESAAREAFAPVHPAAA